MSVISTTNDALNLAATRIQKTKYFSVELQCAGMQPNTSYDFFVDGVNMNSFVKPFGGNLGDPILSGPDGKVLLQYHMAIPFLSQYLVQNTNQQGYIAQTKRLELIDPNGRSSITYLPTRMRSQ